MIVCYNSDRILRYILLFLYRMWSLLLSLPSGGVGLIIVEVRGETVMGKQDPYLLLGTQIHTWFNLSGESMNVD